MKKQELVLEEGKRYRLKLGNESITAVCVEVRTHWADGDGEGSHVDPFAFIPGDHHMWNEDGSRNPLGFFVAEQDWESIYVPPDNTLTAGQIVCTALPDEHCELLED